VKLLLYYLGLYHAPGSTLGLAMALKLETATKPSELIEEYRHGFHDPKTTSLSP